MTTVNENLEKIVKVLDILLSRIEALEKESENTKTLARTLEGRVSVAEAQGWRHDADVRTAKNMADTAVSAVADMSTDVDSHTTEITGLRRDLGVLAKVVEGLMPDPMEEFDDAEVLEALK